MGGRYDRHQLRDRWHGQTQRLHHRNVGRWYEHEDEKLRQARQGRGGWDCGDEDEGFIR